MSLGPGGKYDKECEELLVKLGAECVMLIVGDGERGSGFSITIKPKKRHPLHVLKAVFLSLIDVSRQLQRDIARLERDLAASIKANKQ